MEELKFKAWDKTNKKWFLPPHPVESIIGNFMMTADGRVYIEGKYQDLEILQFTGLYDKNGKEIWEGDIVKHQPRYVADAELEIDHDDDWVGIGLVKYSPYCMAFIFDLISGHKWTFYGPESAEWYKDCLEVIGNKFDNPEMCEKGEIIQ